MQVPIVADHLGRMHGAVSPVAAGQGGGCAVTVTAPADTFGVFGVEREWLGHEQAPQRWAVIGSYGWRRPTALTNVKNGYVYIPGNLTGIIIIYSKAF
jgi:hypothetical protein